MRWNVICGLIFAVIAGFAAFSHVEAAEPWQMIGWWNLITRSMHALVTATGMLALWTGRFYTLFDEDDDE